MTDHQQVFVHKATEEQGGGIRPACGVTDAPHQLSQEWGGVDCPACLELAPERYVEHLKNREGDQPLPTGDESIPDDQSLLIADIEARRQVGIQRYLQGHRPFNGRDTFQDLYEEHLDFLVYLRSVKRMGEATRSELIEVVAKALHPVYDGEDEATAEIAVDAIQGWVYANLMEAR